MIRAQERTVKIAVVSDIHANWHALDAVLADVRAQAPDEVWCLGDLVGYGPQPNRCTEEIRSRAQACLAGNHDLGVIGTVDLADFSPDAATVARWTVETLDDEPRSFLESLSPTGERNGVQMFHGSPKDPVWEYVLSEGAARAALELTSSDLVLVGHSHIPIALRLVDGTIAGGLARGGSEIDLSQGRWLLNPGAVGQPRDGDPRAAYLLVDFEAQSAHFRRVPYDVEATQAELRELGLPEALAERLAGGE
jgi:diadenosine tetraphosphatase ApaH/serine/threonine PP2A family protein phosphatase